MGGSIRKEMNHKATHLIGSAAHGEKYRYALTFRLNVIRPSWVVDAWNHRDEPNFTAKDEAFTAEHRLKIFEGCRIAFIGFPETEKQNMVELLRSYNGVECSSDDENCTHKVRDFGCNLGKFRMIFVLLSVLITFFWKIVNQTNTQNLILSNH